MSQSETVTIDETVTLPSGIAAAFNRSLRVLRESDAFVDRAFEVQSLVAEVSSWRWAGVISGEQCNLLHRKVRAEFSREPGRISEGESKTAEEIDAWDREREARYAEEEAQFLAAKVAQA